LGRSAGNQHCTKHREVEEACGEKEQEVEKLVCLPLIANHSVDRDSIKNTLSYAVERLHGCLYTSISFNWRSFSRQFVYAKVQK
jgi:hypothetical protein